MYIKPADLPSFLTDSLNHKINQYKFEEQRKQIVTVVAVDGPTSIWILWDNENNNVSIMYYSLFT